MSVSSACAPVPFGALRCPSVPFGPVRPRSIFIGTRHRFLSGVLRFTFPFLCVANSLFCCERNIRADRSRKRKAIDLRAFIVRWYVPAYESAPSRHAKEITSTDSLTLKASPNHVLERHRDLLRFFCNLELEATLQFYVTTPWWLRNDIVSWNASYRS